MIKKLVEYAPDIPTIAIIWSAVTIVLIMAWKC
jgi:hypothetical protein